MFSDFLDGIVHLPNLVILRYYYKLCLTPNAMRSKNVGIHIPLLGYLKGE